MEASIERSLKAISEMRNLSNTAAKEIKKIKSLYSKGDFIKINNIVEKKEFERLFHNLKLENLYEELKSELHSYLSKIRKGFDKTFKDECMKLGIQEIHGNSMEQFRIKGILSVKTNFSANICEISTFAKTNKIKSTNATTIALQVKKEIARLFERQFEPKQFLIKLFDAYRKLKTDSTNNILLKDVHRTIWMNIQKNDFFEKSDPSKINPYPIDEYSIDLSKLVNSNLKKLDNDIEFRLSLGSGGVNIYKNDGNFNSYKYIEFIKGDANG